MQLWMYWSTFEWEMMFCLWNTLYTMIIIFSWKYHGIYYHDTYHWYFRANSTVPDGRVTVELRRWLDPRWGLYATYGPGLGPPTSPDAGLTQSTPSATSSTRRSRQSSFRHHRSQRPEQHQLFLFPGENYFLCGHTQADTRGENTRNRNTKNPTFSVTVMYNVKYMVQHRGYMKLIQECGAVNRWWEN